MISRGISTAAAGLVVAVLLAQTVPVSAAQPAVRAGHVIHRTARAPQTFKTSSEPAQPSSQAASPRVLPTIGGSWTSLGPTTISPEKSTGRGLALIVNGANLFVGGADGGIWKTTLPLAATPSWIPLTDGAASTNLAIQSFAIDPSDPTKMYAGTGELANAIDASYGEGVYTSADSGATWTLHPVAAGDDLSVPAVAVDSGGNVYAATAQHYGNESGIYKSTDHGSSWALLPAAANLLHHDITDLVIGADDTIYAAEGDPTNGTPNTNGIYRLKTTDVAFTNTTATIVAALGLTVTTYRWRLSMPARGTPTIWAIAGGGFNDGVIKAVLETTNGGDTWLDKSGGTISTHSSIIWQDGTNNPVQQAWYDLEITASPNNAAHVFVGTHDIFETTDATSGTPSWTDLTNVYNGGPTGTGAAANIHPDQHALIFNGSILLAGNDGGVYLGSEAAPATWGPRNGSLNLAQFYGGAVAANPSQVLGGLQDNGSIYTATAGPGWADETSGDGFFTAIDPSNANFLYAEFPEGNLLLSSTGPSGLGTATSFTPNNTTEPAEFSADLILDPNNPATVYSARYHLWWNTNHGSGTWSASNPTGVTPAPNNCFSPGCIHRIAVAPSNSNELFVIGTGGNVAGDDTFRAMAGPAGAWTMVDGTVGCVTASDLSPKSCAQLNNGEVTDVAIDGQNNQFVYETVDGFSPTAGRHVFKSTNAGNNWADVSTSLPNVPFETVVVNGGVVYAGSDNGVYASLDGGSSWSLLGTNLPNARVFFLVVRSSTVFAFTHGRGAWKIPALTSRGAVLPAPPTAAPTRDPVIPSQPTAAPARGPVNPGTASSRIALPTTIAPTAQAALAPSTLVESDTTTRSWSDLQFRRQRWAF